MPILDDLMAGSLCVLEPRKCACGELVLIELGRTLQPEESEFWAFDRDWQYHDASTPTIVHECEAGDRHRERQVAWAMAIQRDHVAAIALRERVREQMSLPAVRGRRQAPLVGGVTLDYERQ